MPDAALSCRIDCCHKVATSLSSSMTTFRLRRPLLLLSCTRLGLGSLGGEDVPGAAPVVDEALDIAHIVLGLAHVEEAGAAGALGPAPDDVDTTYAGAVDLEPHLDADLYQVVAQQDGRVDAGAPDGKAYSGKCVAALARDLQDVAGADAVPARLVEEGAAGSRAIETSDLLCVEGEHGLRVGDLRGGNTRIHSKGSADGLLWVLGSDCVCMESGLLAWISRE